MRNPFPAAAAVLSLGVLPAANAALEITNGDFQADLAQTSNVTGWFDRLTANPANWWEATWAGPSVSPNGTSVLGLSYLNAQTNWAYQSIGTNSESLASINLQFDAGSFTDAGGPRDLGVTISIYKSDGTFVPADDVDIDGATGVTLLDSFSWSATVDPGQMETGIQAVLDLSEAGPDDEVFLRLENFAGETGEPWTAVDNLIIVPDVPVFVMQPEGLFGNVGSTITLTASAVSEPPPAYQWQYSPNGAEPWTDIDEETSASLVLDPAGYGDNGSYRVVADNGSATATSDEVQLDLVYPDPLITSQPEGGALESGKDVSFTVEATGLGTLEYQWHKVGDAAVTDGGRISGATTATLAITDVQPEDAGFYYCEIFDRAATEEGLGGIDGYATSEDAEFGVFEVPASGLLSFEPFISYPSGVALAGQNPSIAGYSGPWLDEAFGNAVPVTGEPSLTFGGPGYVDGIGGKVGKPADAAAPSAANSGRAARLLATELRASGISDRTLYLSWLFRTGNENAADSADNYQVLGLWNGSSGDDALRVFEAGIALTDFGTANYGFRVNNTTSFDLAVTPDSDVHLFVAKFILGPGPGEDSVTVWLDPETGSGEPEGGVSADGLDLSFDRITLSDYASNSSEWDEIRWGATFDAVTGAAPDVPLVPEFTLQPVDHFGFVGETFSLTAVAESEPAPDYQWEYDDGSGSGFVPLEGETGQSLDFSPGTYAANGSYRVTASNVNGDAVSDVVLVDLLYPAPAITQQPASVGAVAGTDVELSVVAAGLGNLSYQWFRTDIDGDVELEGETAATLTLSAVGPGDAGSYYVIVTDDAAVEDEGFPTETISVPAVVVLGDMLVSASLAAPAIDSFDQFHLPGNVDDVDNIGGSPGGVPIAASGANDASTYVAPDRTSQGMTFTTGPDPLGYTIASVTVRHVMWNNFLGNGTWYNVQTGDTFEFQIGQISGTTKTPIFSTSTAIYTGDPLVGDGASGTGTYLTFDLSGLELGTLAPNTTYYFEIAAEAGDPFFELSGSSFDGYAGGTAFRGDTAATIDGTYVELAGDRAFHADLTGLSGPAEDFASWIALYPEVGAQNGFGDDPDGDGLANGLESFLGTDPSSGNSGIVEVAEDGDTLTFQHPQNPAPPADVAAGYRWSLDLGTWHADGATIDGTTAAFAASPDTPSAGTTTVTVTLSGTPRAKIFVRLEASFAP